MEFTRQLKIIRKGESKAQDAKLWIGQLQPDAIGWVWHFSIEHVRPNPFPIAGPDPMGALYHCVNYLEGFIRELEHQGHQIWFEQRGDHGGFLFRHSPQ